MKSLFIRCSQETYELAHALAKSESRSLNKQVIYMIHKEAEKHNLSLDKPEDKKSDVGYDANGSPTNDYDSKESKLGLTRLAETKKLERSD